MVEDRNYKYKADDKLLNEQERQVLKTILVGRSSEVQDVFVENQMEVIELVRKAFLSSQFKVTDIAWLYAIVYCDVTFSELEKSNTVGRRIETNWSDTATNVKGYLRTSELVNAYFFAMAKAMLEIAHEGRFNDFGFAYGADGLDAKTLQRSNLRTLSYALENEKLPTDRILLIGNWPAQAVDMQRSVFKDEKEFRQAVIAQMKPYL